VSEAGQEASPNVVVHESILGRNGVLRQGESGKSDGGSEVHAGCLIADGGGDCEGNKDEIGQESSIYTRASSSSNAVGRAE
jgi:hypothetical protein